MIRFSRSRWFWKSTRKGAAGLPELESRILANRYITITGKQGDPGTPGTPGTNGTDGAPGATGPAGPAISISNVSLILWCGDSYSDQSNFWAIDDTTGGPNTNGNTYATNVINYLKQNSNGRYTTAGSAPNPLGQNYSVSGSGIAEEQLTNTTLPNQITKLLTDYPTLPANNLVVIAIGGNDFGVAWVRFS